VTTTTDLREFPADELYAAAWNYSQRGIGAHIEAGAPDSVHAGSDVLFVNGRPVGFSVRAA